MLPDDVTAGFSVVKKIEIYVYVSRRIKIQTLSSGL